MATQQEQRRRLRRNSARSGSGGGAGSTPQQEQRRGARRNQSRGGSGTSSARNQGRGVRFSRNVRDTVKSAASGTANATKKVRGRIRHPRGGPPSPPPGAQGTASRFTGADASPEARAQARANAQAARGTGGASGGSAARGSASSGTAPRGPAPDVTIDRSSVRQPGRFSKWMGRGLRWGTGPASVGVQTALWSDPLGAGSDETEGNEPFRGEGASDISPERAAELEAAGGTLPDGVPTAEEVEAATTPGAEDPSEITWTDRNGRIRVQRDRPETMGPDGTQIEAARGDEAAAARLQLGAPAPELPGTSPDEQEIIRVTDGEGGVGTLRAPAGARDGGGTFSTMKNVAAAAVPVDTQGVHEARMAAVQRGERLPSEGGGPTRRERLRREIRQTQGLDQTLSSAMSEGLRRRNARRELDAMDAQGIQDSRNAAAMARTRLKRRPTALEISEEQRARQEAQQETAQQRRENAQADREEYRVMIDRMYDPETEQGRRQRNELEGVIQRSGWSRTPENLRMADDVMRTGDALNDAIENENQLQVADIFGGGPDNPLSNVEMPPISQLADFFGVAGQRPNKAKTIQDELARIVEMTHTRTDDDVIWDDRVVDVGGTEIEMRDIPQGIRALIDNIRARAGQDNLYNPDAPRTD